MFERFALSGAAPVLTAERVYLRPPILADWPAWARLRTESRDFLVPWEPTWPDDALTSAAFRRRLRRTTREAREDTGYSFFIFRRADDALLGGITLSNVRRGVAQAASVGYWMGKPWAGHGYMREALGETVGYVFDMLLLRRLEAACLPSNTRSQALLRRVGFEQEGYARGYLCINGRWQDHLLFALLATDLRR